MRDDTRDALVGHLSDYDSVVEIGIGHRVEVAEALARTGVRVTATDIRPRATPVDIEFVLDDVTVPDTSLYADADAIYALNFPPELHEPALDLAREVDAEFLFTTLGADPPAVRVRRETIPGDTLFVASV